MSSRVDPFMVGPNSCWDCEEATFSRLHFFPDTGEIFCSDCCYYKAKYKKEHSMRQYGRCETCGKICWTLTGDFYCDYPCWTNKSPGTWRDLTRALKEKESMWPFDRANKSPVTWTDLTRALEDNRQYLRKVERDFTLGLQSFFKASKEVDEIERRHRIDFTVLKERIQSLEEMVTLKQGSKEPSSNDMKYFIMGQWYRLIDHRPIMGKYGYIGKEGAPRTHCWGFFYLDGDSIRFECKTGHHHYGTTGCSAKEADIFMYVEDIPSK